jgi:hypothetical protein
LTISLARLAASDQSGSVFVIVYLFLYEVTAQDALSTFALTTLTVFAHIFVPCFTAILSVFIAVLERSGRDLTGMPRRCKLDMPVNPDRTITHS